MSSERPGSRRRRRPASADDDWLELEDDVENAEDWLELDDERPEPRRTKRKGPARRPRRESRTPPKRTKPDDVPRARKSPSIRQHRRETQQVPGRVLSPKLGKPFGLVISGFGGLLVVYYLFGWLLDFDKLPAMSARILAYMILLGVIGTYGFLSTAYVMVRWRRIVIGEDRLQLLAPSGRVIGQIPYDNLSLLETGQHLILDTRQIDLCVRSRKHRDTWWPRFNHRNAEYDITIKGDFEVDATHVRLLLKKALDKYEASGGRR